MEKITDAVMSEKPRYAILDGLRGVAAVIVVAFHLFETYSKAATTSNEHHQKPAFTRISFPIRNSNNPPKNG